MHVSEIGSVRDSLFESSQQLLICFICGDLGEIRFDLIRGAEEETSLSSLDHIQIIVAVSGGHSFKANGLERSYSRKLGLLDAHAKACDLAVWSHFQRIAEQSGPSQLLHKRGSKLSKGIADDDHLANGAQLV